MFILLIIVCVWVACCSCSQRPQSNNCHIIYIAHSQQPALTIPVLSNQSSCVAILSDMRHRRILCGFVNIVPRVTRQVLRWYVMSWSDRQCAIRYQSTRPLSKVLQKLLFAVQAKDLDRTNFEGWTDNVEDSDACQWDCETLKLNIAFFIDALNRQLILKMIQS